VETRTHFKNGHVPTMQFVGKVTEKSKKYNVSKSF